MFCKYVSTQLFLIHLHLLPHLTPSDSSADMCNSCKCSLHIVVAIAGLVGVVVAVAFAMVGFALDFGVWKTCTNNKTKTKAKMKSLYELF